MSRSLSFGYNAAASIVELVMQRLVRALFEDGTVNDTMTSAIKLSDTASATVNLLVTAPSVELDVSSKPDHVRLTVMIHAVLDFPGTGAPGIQDGDWIKAQLSLTPAIVIKKEKLYPDFASLSAAEFSLTNVSSNNPALMALAPLFLKDELHKIIGASDLTKLAVPFGLDKDGMLADAFDTRVADGPPPTDLDELVFAAYDSANAGTTQGDAASITPMMEGGKSLTIRLSQPTFDALFKEQLDAAYMRFDVTLGNTQDEQKRKISWGKPYIDLFNAGHYVWVNNDNRRANLRNVTMTNLRTGEKRVISTNSAGACKYTVLASGIPVADLKAGDTLRFHGEYRYEQKTRIYYPSFKLGEGYIELAVQAVRDVVCYDDVDIDLKVTLYLSIDPATGKVSVKTGSPDIDMPWYVDAGVFFVKFFVAIFTGPFSGIIFGDIESQITDEVSKEGQKQTGSLLPSLATNPYMRVFWESIKVKSIGLVLGGQIEAGWLAGGGRHKGLLVLTLDRKGKEYQQLVVNIGQASAWLVRFDPNHQVTDPYSVLAVLSKATKFEALDSETLHNLTLQVTGTSVSLPAEKDLASRVLAVRTAWGRLVKVRFDRAENQTWVLRWISYNRRTSNSAVTITGDWKSDAKVVGSQMLIWTSVHKYEGTFGLKLTNFFTTSGLKITWNYKGPGGFKVVSGDKRKVHVAVDADDLASQTFTGTLMVAVEDIFGRKAAASRTLAGSKSWGKPGPGTEIAIHPDELAIEMHGPGPVSLPPDPNVLISQLHERIARLEARLETASKDKQKPMDEGPLTG